uniref:Uncharacterized protein n=1 Tax=Ascaris lumbricoides TaxID=6252 RepID=A0A9J2Q6R3_ASCLU
MLMVIWQNGDPILAECEAAKTSHCEGQSASVLKELTTLCEETSTSLFASLQNVKQQRRVIAKVKVQLAECEAAKTSHCEGQSASVLKELTTLCEETSTSYTIIELNEIYEVRLWGDLFIMRSYAKVCLSLFTVFSGELPSYALVISAMLFMLITAEIVMILFALWIKYIEDKWWEEQTSHQKSNTNT